MAGADTRFGAGLFEIPKHLAARFGVGLDADEADAPVIDPHLSLGHGAPNGVSRGMRADLLEHLPLAVLIFADAEGHQLIERQRPPR